jgi:hypothetical protein
MGRCGSRSLRGPLPTRAWDAFTDFSERRLQIWDRTLDPKTYEVRDQGETWAVVRESSPRSPFWVVVRYDWSESDRSVIRSTVVESSYGGGGEGVVRISPGPGTGSRVYAGGTPRGRARCSAPCCSSCTTARCGG